MAEKSVPTQKRLVLLSGRSHPELAESVADELGIAIRTVEVHRARAFTKLGLRSAAELATMLERFEVKGGSGRPDHQ